MKAVVMAGGEGSRLRPLTLRRPKPMVPVVDRPVISHILELQTLKDDNDDFVLPEEMVRRLIADNRHVAETQRAAIEVCDQNRDTPTGNILQEILDQTEKRIWFLHAVSQGGHNME